MDDLCEISITNVCCTCLSTERNLSQLCQIDDGVNNLFFLLSYKSEAYQAMFVKDVTDLFICWECTAIIQRIVRFREQACVAQFRLTDIADGKINFSEIKCLSKLSYSRQMEVTFNQEAGILMPALRVKTPALRVETPALRVETPALCVETPENFVDCGSEITNMRVETQSDSDEVSLAQLNFLNKEVAINNDEVDDKYDDCATSDTDSIDSSIVHAMSDTGSIDSSVVYVLTDEDTLDSSVLKKSNNDTTTIKNSDTVTPIIKYRNNVISSSINKSEKLVDCSDTEKSKNIERRQRLADISDDKETDQEIISKTGIEKAKNKTKVNKKNREAYNVNIPISSEKNEKPNLDDGNIVSFMTKKVLSHKKTANGRKFKYFTITHMNEAEMVKSIEMRKLEVDYVKALNKCESCIEIFEDCDSVEKHLSELHELKPNHALCNICKVYVKDIKEHKILHYLKYECRICRESLQYRISCKKNLVNHLKTKHLKQETYIDQQLKLLKEVEDKLLYSIQHQEMFRTILEVPVESPVSACVECNRRFKNKKRRDYHIQKFHRDGFQCPTCGKKFAYILNLQKHELTHNEKPLSREECSVCGKMVRAEFMKRHAQTHTEGEYACVECDKKFLSRAIYEKHLKYTRIHANRQIFKHKCSVCGKDFRKLDELRDHYNFAHLGKTQHKCPVCDKALATRRSVTKHVKRAHSGAKEKVRDKICQICGKGFTTLITLKEHESTHSAERPLICDICAHTFRQKASLYTHKRLVHKVARKRKLVHTDEIIVPDSEINKISD